MKNKFGKIACLGSLQKSNTDQQGVNVPHTQKSKNTKLREFFSTAIEQCNLTKEDFENDSYVDFDEGHFFENGLQSLNLKSTQIMLNVISKLENGYEKVTKIIRAGGITTIADMEVHCVAYL